MIMRLFVDSDNAGDKVTCRSRTGYVVFLQNLPIAWFSKKQSSVETSTFGSEFMAMKTATKYIQGLRYKLQMMGISILGPCLTYGDNNAVVTNSTLPDSVLKKKTKSVAYIFVREEQPEMSGDVDTSQLMRTSVISILSPWHLVMLGHVRGEYFIHNC